MRFLCLVTVGWLVIANSAEACRPPPQPPPERAMDGSLIPAYSQSDYAFVGEIVGTVEVRGEDRQTSRGLQVRVIESATAKALRGDLLTLTSYELTGAACEHRRPVALAASQFPPGAKLRVVSDGLAIPARERLRRLAVVTHVSASLRKASGALWATPARAVCGFPDVDFPEDLAVFAAGTTRARELDLQIDQSGNPASQIDVFVHSPERPVALLLGAGGPTIWTVQWSPGTRIVAVLVGGVRRQAVAGLPNTVPIVNSSPANRGPCETFQIPASTRAQLDALARRVFGRSVDWVFLANGDRVVVGERPPDAVRWVSSPEVTPESFFDPAAPLAGGAGLVDAVRKGLLREATAADVEAWVAAVRPGTDARRIEGRGQPKFPVRGRLYVVLGPFTFPAGGYSATFFVPKGVSMPTGDPGHSIVYDFNALQWCDGTHCRPGH